MKAITSDYRKTHVHFSQQAKGTRWDVALKGRLLFSVLLHRVSDSFVGASNCAQEVEE